MEFNLREHTVEEIVNGYKDSKEEGVVAFGGKLDIRPAYQREFIYKDKQRNAVIETVFDSGPLNLMYWAKTGVDTYEVLDGQQRTLSICHYVNGDFSLGNRFFHNLTNEERKKVLDYKLLVCVCQGSPKELLNWFEKVNVAGEKLTAQELRNAVYTGPWLNDAKAKFSRNNCPAKLLADDRGPLIVGNPIRQDYLETTLKWITEGEVEQYMAQHQHDENAEELWQYFQSVISWVRNTFPVYREVMRKVQWGPLYNKFGSGKFDTDAFETKIQKLMVDDEVQKKQGIYEYLFTGEEKHLNIRAFSEGQKIAAYERQGGTCSRCKGHFQMTEMEADHIDPWHEGGKTSAENCQMLCKHDNRIKGGS